MNIYQFIGRHIEITEAMRNYAEEKLSKLDRFSNQIMDAKVVMSYSKSKTINPAKVEIQINVPHGIVRAEESGADSYAAIDLVTDKLERQLKRLKGRFISRRNEDLPEVYQEEQDEEEPQIVRIKKHVLRPMSPEDAALQMDALGHDFYMFLNSDSNLISVIYLRDDGHYGLLEPKK
ncbi:MAG TPA: ribosome-associated translation inhibitor RaiA [Trueperaceae bacterium]|nr:ribosome-associated translation inhibitor RaiA [Trueperaceae bacterium]